MNEERLSKDFKLALSDRYEGWELVEFLQISVDDVIDAFEDQILTGAQELRQDMGMEEDEEESRSGFLLD